MADEVCTGLFRAASLLIQTNLSMARIMRITETRYNLRSAGLSFRQTFTIGRGHGLAPDIASYMPLGMSDFLSTRLLAPTS